MPLSLQTVLSDGDTLLCVACFGLCNGHPTQDGMTPCHPPSTRGPLPPQPKGAVFMGPLCSPPPHLCCRFPQREPGARAYPSISASEVASGLALVAPAKPPPRTFFFFFLPCQDLLQFAFPPEKPLGTKKL